MKSSLFAAAALAASSTAALAGGYVAPVVEAPVVAPVAVAVAPTYNWSGAYVGAQIGRVDGTLKYPEVLARDNQDVTGNSYGVHAGYLHDFGRFVGGAEISWNKLDSVDFDGVDESYSGSMLQGKLMAGYNAGRFLPYVSLGGSQVTIKDVLANGSDVDTSGWFVGVGAKFAVTDNFLIGAEVQRHRFGEVKDLSAPNGDKTKLDGTTFGISASYKF